MRPTHLPAPSDMAVACGRRWSLHCMSGAMYASGPGPTFDLVTDDVRSLSSTHRDFPLADNMPLAHAPRSTGVDTERVPISGLVRISVARHLPQVLRGFGFDSREVLATAGLNPDLFDDPENLVEYADLQRLLVASEKLTNCDYIGLLVAQGNRLADYGLAGRAALCAPTVGEALHTFARHFNLHSSATTVSILTSAGVARLVYAISVGGLTDTRQFQLGAVAVAYNILRELCGKQWVPTVVTFATRAPANLRPLQQLFHAPLRFDSSESAVDFELHWLDRPLAPVDPALRRQVKAEVDARQAAIEADFAATVRRILRKQIVSGNIGMDETSALLGMHRRTLDRRLHEHGVRYGELLESVQEDVAQQLLRDTRMRVQQIAEALQFSTAANFATAFRRWTGCTPSEFRRRNA